MYRVNLLLCKFQVLEIRKKSSNDTGSTGKFEIPAKIVWKLNRLIYCCASFNKSLVCCCSARKIRKKLSNDNGYFNGHLGNLNFPPKFIISFAKKIFCQMTLGISRQGSTEKFEFPAKIVEYCWKRNKNRQMTLDKLGNLNFPPKLFLQGFAKIWKGNLPG